MPIIKIAFRQIIDFKSVSEFERNVFKDSFSEFYLQAQAYNPDRKFKTLHELIEHNPKANSLHYKVGFSIALYIQGLKNIIPTLEDSIGRALSFQDHHFEILHSDVTNRAAHMVAITYISNSMNLVAISGGYLIVNDTSRKETKQHLTLTIPLQQNLSIVEWSQTDGTHNEKYEVEKQNN